MHLWLVFIVFGKFKKKWAEKLIMRKIQQILQMLIVDLRTLKLKQKYSKLKQNPSKFVWPKTTTSGVEG
jgi:hypothetical protein